MRDPEFFRGMTPDLMLSTLIADAADDKHKAASAAGARCARCMDSGLERGKFCSCDAGAKLAVQARR